MIFVLDSGTHLQLKRIGPKACEPWRPRGRWAANQSAISRMTPALEHARSPRPQSALHFEASESYARRGMGASTGHPA